LISAQLFQLILILYMAGLFIACDFEVSRDGQRFLIPVLVEESATEPITVILNWTVELKR